MPPRKGSRYGNEAAAERRFRERSSAGETSATAALERAVIGGDFGANGYTTVAQADVLADVLDLGAGQRLLDVGAGRGWPGLYLAKRSGCDVVLTDLPAEGLRDAQHRARTMRVHQRKDCVVASATWLPYRSRSFDAVVHSDVLC